MLIGYARVSKTDGSQSLDLQRDALRAAGVDEVNLYHDLASGHRDGRPGLDSCLRALRNDDVLVVWKLDRLGRNLAHLVNTVQDLSARGVGLRVLAGQGAQIDTTTAAGRLVFGIFAALAEFERELIRERTRAGLRAARARGRKGGRRFALSKAQVRLAQAAMAHRDTSVSALCRELGISPGDALPATSVPRASYASRGQKVLAFGTGAPDEPQTPPDAHLPMDVVHPRGTSPLTFATRCHTVRPMFARRPSPVARPVARRPSPVARRPSPVARRPSPVARRPS